MKELVSTLTGRRYPFGRIEQFTEDGESLEVRTGNAGFAGFAGFTGIAGIAVEIWKPILAVLMATETSVSKKIGVVKPNSPCK